MADAKCGDHKGFTMIELISIMVIMGIVGAVLVSRIMDNSLYFFKAINKDGNPD